MTVSIFLSHSVKDKKIVEDIKNEFNEKDVDLYIAEQDIQPGSYLLEKIKSAIKKCDLFLVLISKNGTRSTFVQSEIGIAISSGKRVIPLLERGVDIPSQLSGIEYIEFSPEKPEKAIDSLETFLSKFKLSKEHDEFMKQLTDTIAIIAIVILGIILISALLSKK